MSDKFIITYRKQGDSNLYRHVSRHSDLGKVQREARDMAYMYRDVKIMRKRGGYENWTEVKRSRFI